MKNITCVNKALAVGRIFPSLVFSLLLRAHIFRMGDFLPFAALDFATGDTHRKTSLFTSIAFSRKN